MLPTRRSLSRQQFLFLACEGLCFSGMDSTPLHTTALHSTSGFTPRLEVPAPFHNAHDVSIDPRQNVDNFASWWSSSPSMLPLSFPQIGHALHDLDPVLKKYSYESRVGQVNMLAGYVGYVGSVRFARCARCLAFPWCTHGPFW